MKRLAVFLLSAVVAPSLVHAQGELIFQDFDPGSADQATGLGFVGSDFSTGLWWGTVNDPSTFQLVPASVQAYFGTTGGSPNSDGAGLFGFGNLAIPGQGGGTTIWVQQRSWRTTGEGGGADFLSSLWQGIGTPQQIMLAEGATPRNAITPEALSIVFIPEPSTFALAGLGSAALLIFRRRK